MKDMEAKQALHFPVDIMDSKLKELVWRLDREVWAKVEVHEATQSWGREQTAKLIIEYFGLSGWFDVNELPELKLNDAVVPFYESEWVLVKTKDSVRPEISRLQKGNTKAGIKWEQWLSAESGYDLRNVTHWMFLPKF